MREAIVRTILLNSVSSNEREIAVALMDILHFIYHFNNGVNTIDSHLISHNIEVILTFIARILSGFNQNSVVFEQYKDLLNEIVENMSRIERVNEDLIKFSETL